MSDLVKHVALPAPATPNVEAPMSFSLGATAAIALAALVVGFIVSERATMALEAAEEEEEGALEVRRPRRRRKKRKS